MRLCRICAESLGDAIVSLCSECKQYECHACWHKKHGCEDPGCLAHQMDIEDAKAAA